MAGRMGKYVDTYNIRKGRVRTHFFVQYRATKDPEGITLPGSLRFGIVPSIVPA